MVLFIEPGIKGAYTVTVNEQVAVLLHPSVTVHFIVVLPTPNVVPFNVFPVAGLTVDVPEEVYAIVVGFGVAHPPSGLVIGFHAEVAV